MSRPERFSCEPSDAARRANAAVIVETLTIGFFLAGLALLTALLVGLVSVCADRLLPGEWPPDPEQSIFPWLRPEGWSLGVAVAVMLGEAALLMSVGLVLRHFLKSRAAESREGDVQGS